MHVFDNYIPELTNCCRMFPFYTLSKHQKTLKMKDCVVMELNTSYFNFFLLYLKYHELYFISVTQLIGTWQMSNSASFLNCISFAISFYLQRFTNNRSMLIYFLVSVMILVFIYGILTLDRLITVYIFISVILVWIIK